MSTAASNTIGALVLAVVALVVAIVILAFLHHFERTDRHHSDRRADWLQYRLDRAHEQLGQMVLKDKPAPALPPAETQRLPRIPKTTAYRPGVAAGRPGTDLVPADRTPARTR